MEKSGRKKGEVGHSPSSHTEQPSRNKVAGYWEVKASSEYLPLLFRCVSGLLTAQLTSEGRAQRCVSPPVITWYEGTSPLAFPSKTYNPHQS